MRVEAFRHDHPVDGAVRANLTVYRLRPDVLAELARRLEAMAERAAGTARTTPW